MKYAYFSARLGLLALVVGFIGSLSVTLLQDIRSLQEARAAEQRSRVVGYEGITPRLSFARHPEDWFRREGEVCRLWSGWTPGVGHGWFLVEPGAFDPKRLAGFLGRDVVRAVDKGIFETEGGPRWSRIPSQAQVYSLESLGIDLAFPHRVLDKVGIVNALVDDRPMLIVFEPWAPRDQAALVYDARPQSGPRPRMGSTGYFLDSHPLLYDRRTESLWVAGSAGLKALSGPRRGECLPFSQRLELCSWSAWKDKHPDGQVLVGADRSGEKYPVRPAFTEDLARKD